MSLWQKLGRFLATLPAILLMTMLNVFIASATSGVVMIQLMAGGCQKYVALGVAILTAIGTMSWIVWNHKLRAYIKARSLE